MKKVFSLVLASVMCLGMCTVAFAASAKYSVLDVGMGENSNLVDNGYKAENGKVSTAVSGTNIVPGDVIYVPVQVSQDTENPGVFNPAKLVNKTTALQDFKVSYRINDDEERLLRKVEWVLKKNGNNDSTLYLALTLRDKVILESTVVNATVTISPKKDAAVNGVTGDATYNVSMTVGYPEIYTDGGYEYIEKEGAILMAVDRNADELTLGFPEDVEVSGDFGGSKDTLFKMDTYDDSLANKYPYAEFRLFKNGGTQKNILKREVTVTIPYDAETPYLYVLRDGKLVALYANRKANGAKYVDNAFVFDTTVLEDYVLSDEALQSESQPSEDSSSKVEETTTPTTTPDTDVPVKNPDTGAHDMVGLAVALAVVSVVGIAAAIKK